MDIILNDTPFARMVGEALTAEMFTLVDIGVAGGLPHGWRSFGPRLKAYGFDTLADEIAALNAAEALPHVTYVAALVAAAQGPSGPSVSNSPWDRLAVKAWFDRQGAAPEAPPAPDLPVVVLPQFLRQAGTDQLDFIKIDVDGPDFDILRSIAPSLDDLGVLGVGLEVNFIGGDGPDEHSFHNTDRLLRAHGYELFNMSTRHYSARDLPGRSPHAYPADTNFGRLLQGDAVYLRDLCAPRHAALAAAASPERLAKLAAIQSLFGLPDCAAEVLVTFRDRLEAVIDVDLGLDVLAAQAQAGDPRPLSYPEYIAAFAAGAGYFRTGPDSPADLQSARPALVAGRPVLSAFSASHYVAHGEAKADGAPVVAVTTGPGMGSFAAEFKLDPAGAPAASRLLVRLEVEVQSGAVGLAVLNAARGSFHHEAVVTAEEGPAEVWLTTPSIEAAGSLLVRNAQAEPSRAAVRIVSVTALERDAGAPL